VLQLEVFVGKFLAVYALAPRAIEIRKITALNHKILNDAMKYAAAVSVKILQHASDRTNCVQYPKPFSPVQSARKFSAVCRNQIQVLPLKA
jgi:hypothetical protein